MLKSPGNIQFLINRVTNLKRLTKLGVKGDALTTTPKTETHLTIFMEKNKKSF